MKIQEIDAFNRHDIPKQGETIVDDIVNLEKTIPLVKCLDIYFRDKEACPFGRGNWIIDIIFSDSQALMFKLPKEMSEKQVMDYSKPLIEKLESYQKQKSGLS
jgi:hypothetical protein